jgi:hypothetical protein
MSQGRIAFSSLALSAIFSVALAMPSADAQPRPGQPGQLSPGPGQPAPPAQRGPTPGQPPQPAPPKPYKEIAVTLPQSSSDPSFEAFLKQLDDVAMKKDRAALARLVVPTNFFWIGEVNGREGDKANKRKSGIDNLAAAVDLDDKEGSGWVVIAEAAKEPSLEPMQQRRGVFCSPAGPIFDEKAAEQLGKATGTNEFDWASPTKPGIDVYASAQPNSPVVGKLGMYLIRVMPEEPPAGNEAPQSPFVRVVMSNGKVGYVAAEFLSPTTFDQLCYLKDGSGWKIAGYNGTN